jgi:hypothetical protein
MSTPTTVLESNAFGVPFTMDVLWEERQQRALALRVEAAARAARSQLRRKK